MPPWGPNNETRIPWVVSLAMRPDLIYRATFSAYSTILHVVAKHSYRNRIFPIVEMNFVALDISCGFHVSMYWHF